MPDYGKRYKRISFMDTDKRNADLLIKLKHDGLTKTKFFRAVLTAYLKEDIEFMALVQKHKDSHGHQSKSKSRLVDVAREKGRENLEKFGIGSDEIQNIFDMLEKEHPDL